MDSLTIMLLIVLVVLWSGFFAVRHAVNKLKKDHEEKLKAEKQQP